MSAQSNAEAIRKGYDAFSRGEIALASPRPEDNPVIEENMLDDPRDLTAALSALARRRRRKALAWHATRSR